MQTIPKTSDVVAKLRAGEAPPVAAFRVFGAPVELAEENNGADAKSIKVRLKARQRGPINHWYWGTVWHDLSTMRSRAKIALDDTHDVEIGYGRPVQTEYGLEVEGVVIPDEKNPAHESNRIAYNLRNGIPQEASIDFGGDYEVVEIPEGMSMTINGMSAAGPALVVQNWPLRACAICKEGADSSTETYQLTSGSTLAALPRALTTFANPKENTMTDTPSAQPPVEAPAEGAPANPTQQAEAPAVEAPPVATPETVTRTEFAAVVAECDKLRADLAAATQRINALTSGQPPVPGNPASAGPKTWMEALSAVRKDKPQFSEPQVHAEASQRFPKLDPNHRS